MQIKDAEIGMIVKYVGHRTDNICIPPIDTTGTIIDILPDRRILQVEWSEGTVLDHRWYIIPREVEEVK